MLFGILSVIVTIVFGCRYGCVFGFAIGIPFLTPSADVSGVGGYCLVFGIACGLGGVIMGVIGNSVAKKSHGQMGGRMALAGTTIGLITMLFAIFWGLFFAAMFWPTPAFTTSPVTYMSDPAKPPVNAEADQPGRK